MGFDAIKFGSDELDVHDCINHYARILSWGDMTDESLTRHKNAMQDFHAVTSLTNVKYSIKVQDATVLDYRKLLSDTKCKAVEGDIHSKIVPFLNKYGVIEVTSATSDIPLINIDIRIDNGSQSRNASCIEIQLTVKRTLLDPASNRPTTAIVWEDKSTLVYTEQNPDLIEDIIRAADTHVFKLALSQFRAVITMKAAIQLEREGTLSVLFSDYITQ